MTIEQTWNNGGYLSGLKGVTIPNNTPSFNEDPRKGRHWSSDNAIQADHFFEFIKRFAGVYNICHLLLRFA